MDWILWVVAVGALILVLLMMRRIRRLSASVEQLKRDKYYTDSRMKRIPEEFREALEPLRHQLARVADGGRVPRDMILEGRLFMDITAEEARRALEANGTSGEGRIMLLDVRTPREFAARRIPGAKLVPFEELDTRYAQEVPADMDRILVYCMGGERSRSACDFLGRRGYANLYNIREGLQGWQGPVEGDGEGGVRLVQIQSLRQKS